MRYIFFYNWTFLIVGLVAKRLRNMKTKRQTMAMEERCATIKMPPDPQGLEKSKTFHTAKVTVTSAVIMRARNEYGLLGLQNNISCYEMKHSFLSGSEGCVCARVCARACARACVSLGLRKDFRMMWAEFIKDVWMKKDDSWPWISLNGWKYASHEFYEQTVFQHLLDISFCLPSCSLHL